MKIDDSLGSESFAYTTFLTVEFSKPYEPLQLKEIEEISATSRCTDWLNKFRVSDWDVRNKVLKGLYKELQRRKRQLILNELREEIAWYEGEGERKKRLRVTKELQWHYLMDWSLKGLDKIDSF